MAGYKLLDWCEGEGGPTVELSGVSQPPSLHAASRFVLADVRSNSVLDELWVFQSPDRPNATPDYACPCATLFTDEPFRLCCLRMRIIGGKPGSLPLDPPTSLRISLPSSPCNS